MNDMTEKPKTAPAWTDGDIEAAYLMGAMNASEHEPTGDTPWESMDRVKAELDRIKANGWKIPDMVRLVRYGHRAGAESPLEPSEDTIGLAHEIWALAQGPPDEGIEDAALRIAARLDQWKNGEPNSTERLDILQKALGKTEGTVAQ